MNCNRLRGNRRFYRSHAIPMGKRSMLSVPLTHEPVYLMNQNYEKLPPLTHYNK